jgi:dTDP-4-dehydrorhamnose reductase
MRVAVTGARGRLGRALIEALEEAPFTGPMGPIAWSRPELDLDTLTEDSVVALIERDRPELVIHAAAWTDVDGCAREPGLAMRRNGTASGLLARACAAHGTGLAVVSTNEVFDGRRTDGRGYATGDPVSPINAYGVSKLAAERLAADEMHAAGLPLVVVRTAWLHGPPGNDFPARIAAAALRAQAAGEPLRVVADEIGCPTYTRDVAEAMAELIGDDALVSGAGAAVTVHHLVNTGRASRAAWTREVLRATGIDVAIEEIPAAAWQRPSTPPRWAVLEPTALPSGAPMRPWTEAFADAVPALLRSLPGHR